MNLFKKLTMALAAMIFAGGAWAAVATPVISGDAEFTDSVTVTITCTSPSTDLYYTTDGSEPDDTKTEYNGPFTITETTTVKAAGFNGNDWSAVAEMTFTKKAAAPTGPEVTPVANATNEWTFTMPASNVVLKVVYYTDQDFADDVAALITAIGNVAYTPECKALIDAAREAYDALTPEQKALVSNSATLTTAEAPYFAAEALANGFKVDNYVLIDYVGAGGDVVIPNGVTQISEGAFVEKAVTSVVIPDSVKPTCKCIIILSSIW